MMAKYLIEETRVVRYTVEVPENVTPGDLQAARLDSNRFWARGCGGIIAEQAEVDYTISACEPDDDEPAEVQLDERLQDKWPPELAAISPVARPHFGTFRGRTAEN